MNRNQWTLAALAVVFAVAVGLLFLDPTPREGALDPSAAGDGSGSNEAGSFEGDPDVGVGDGFEQVSRVPEEGTEESTPEFTAELGTMVVRVLDDESGEPVPGATVHVLDAPDREREALLEKFEAEVDAEDFLRGNGVTLRSDSKGEARMPRPAGLVVACASKGKDFAFAIVGKEQPAETLELRMRPDVTLKLRVVDDKGEPAAGVPVALQTRSRNWSQSGSRRVTGADGRASFPHAQVRIATAPPRSSIWLAVALPLTPMAEVQVDPLAEDLEEEKLLTLSPTGSVRVQVLDYDGREFPRPVEVHLQSYDPAQGEPRRFRPHAAQGHTTTTSELGVATFEQIGTGLQLVAGAVLDGSQDWFVGTGPGPEQPGTMTTIVLRQNRMRPEVVVRILDPDGEPLRSVSVRCVEHTLSTRSRPSERTRNRSTDEEGLLRYTPRSGPLGSLQSRELEVLYRPSRGQPEWRASIDLSHDIADGSQRLGDLQLSAPRLLAAGTVTNPDGATVDGAKVQLYVQREDSRPGQIRWRRERGAETQSAEDGRFEIYGPSSNLAMELRASHPDFLAGSSEAISGFEEHRIVLDSGLRLEGSIVVDDGTMMDHLSVSWYPGHAERDQGRSWVRGSRRVGVEPDGSFSFGAMDAESGWLEVSDRRNSLTLATVEAVEPWPESAIPDGRLDPIDLRGSVQVITLSFTDMAGEPITGVRFSVSVPGSEEAWWNVVRERDGTAEIFAPPGGVDVFVRSNGYRELRIPGVTSDRSIRLETAIPLQFQLSPSSLAAEYDLEIRARSVGDGPRIEPSTLRLGKDGKATATAPRAGPLHLYLRVRYQSGEGRTTSRYVNFGSLGRRLQVEVRDSAGSQVIPVEISRADIEQAINNGR